MNGKGAFQAERQTPLTIQSYEAVWTIKETKDWFCVYCNQRAEDLLQWYKGLV